jgi:hypothetical protein
VLRDDLAQANQNDFQPFRQFAVRGLDATTGNVMQVLTFLIEHTEAGDAQAGINS